MWKPNKLYYHLPTNSKRKGGTEKGEAGYMLMSMQKIILIMEI